MRNLVESKVIEFDPSKLDISLSMDGSGFLRVTLKYNGVAVAEDEQCIKDANLD